MPFNNYRYMSEMGSHAIPRASGKRSSRLILKHPILAPISMNHLNFRSSSKEPKSYESQARPSQTLYQTLEGGLITLPRRVFQIGGWIPCQTPLQIPNRMRQEGQ